MTMSDDELLTALGRAGWFDARSKPLDLIQRLMVRAERAEGQLRELELASTPGAPDAVAAEAPQTKRRDEPYTRRYCGEITTSQPQARDQLCMHCVKFEGDVHPAVTGARIAAHNRRIMGMFERKD